MERVTTKFRNILITSAMLLFSAVSHASPQVELHRQWVENQDTDGWYPAKSTKGNFFIKSPIPFNDYSITTIDPNIGTLVIHGIGSKSSDGYEFGTLQTVLTTKSKKPDLQILIDGVAKRLNATAPKVSFQAKRGEAFGFAELNGPVRTVMMRISATKQNIFQVMCDFPSEQGQIGKDLCGAYLKSFQIE